MNGPPDSPTPRSAPWWRAFAISTAVFVFGAVLGAAVATVVYRNAVPLRFDAPPFRAERLADRLARELDLSPDQSARIREIFRSQHMELKQIRSETEPKVREVLDRTHDLVLAELTEDQRALWQEKYERMRRRMRAPGWDKARGGGGDRSRRDPARMIERNDADGDAMLSFEEASKAWKSVTRDRFASWDRNSDGLLDAAEIAAARGDQAPAEDPNIKISEPDEYGHGP